jgi:hypothetical protein
MIDLDDDRLAQVLASIGALLVTDEAAARAPSRARPRRSAALVMSFAAAVAIVVAVVVVAVAPIRHTVADWLGIGSTRIEIDPTPPPAATAPLSPIGLGLPRIDRAAAEQSLGSTLPALDSTPLGAPMGYAAMPEGGIVVLWPNDTTLWIHRAQMPTGVLFDKMVSAATQVQRVDDLGDDALVVTGDHVLRTPHRLIEAATTVLWTDGDLEYRLDADRSVDEMIDLARQVAVAR